MQVMLHLMVMFGSVFLAADDGKDKGQGQGQAVICQVEKGGMILSLLPDRSVVKKGDVVCELDSADLRDRLIEQTIAAKRAETEYQAARLARELAELASKQYKDSSYLLEKAAIQGEIKLAETNLTSAADQVDRSEQNFEKGSGDQGSESRHRAVVPESQVRPGAGPDEAQRPGKLRQAPRGQAV